MAIQFVNRTGTAREDRKDQIFDFLSGCPSATEREIATALGLKKTWHIKYILREMCEDGELDFAQAKLPNGFPVNLWAIRKELRK